VRFSLIIFGLVLLLPVFAVPITGTTAEVELLLQSGNGQTTVIDEGQAAIEVTDTLHRGKAVAGPVEILVIYAGARDLENSIPKGKAGCS
jgi:hypothetical protein